METLKNKKEISELFKTGFRKKKEPFQVLFKKNNSEFTFFLFACEKKTKKAVDRNRVKRVLRALIKDTKYPIGFNIAIISNLKINSISHTARISILQSLFLKIKQ